MAATPAQPLTQPANRLIPHELFLKYSRISSRCVRRRAGKFITVFISIPVNPYSANTSASTSPQRLRLHFDASLEGSLVKALTGSIVLALYQSG